MVSYELDLNTKTGDVLPRLHVSQYNKGQSVECLIYDGNSPIEIPSGATAMVNGTKPDNTGFEYSATASGSTVTFTITEQMTAVAGEVVCEVVIVNDEERVGTINFLMIVEEAALSDDTVISETDLPIIQRIPEFVQECEAAVELANEWANGGAVGGEPSATNNAYYWAMQAASYAGAGLQPEVVQTLPVSDISTHKIYFVPSTDPSTSNYYDEYINLDGTSAGWEQIGTTAIDLTAYYTKTEVDTLLGGKQNTLTFDNVPTANSSNPVKSGGVYTALDDKQPKTLSAPIAGKTTVETCLAQINTDLTATSKAVTKFIDTPLSGWANIPAHGRAVIKKDIPQLYGKHIMCVVAFTGGAIFVGTYYYENNSMIDYELWNASTSDYLLGTNDTMRIFYYD